MNKVKKYRVVYKHARQFLSGIVAQHDGLNEELLKLHLLQKSKFDSISDANRQLIESLLNRNMMAAVINFRERESRLRAILFDYNPNAIAVEYPNAEGLFNGFKKEFEIRNVNNNRNLWRQWAEGIISGSNFMASFNDKKAFDAFVKIFLLNKYTKAALPMLLSKEIKGFGLALACDFLKELGYRDYPKPDTHLIKIFHSLGLSETEDPYDVYKAIVEMAEAVKEDAYTVDRVFWLIGSGKFYLVDINVGRNSTRFIRSARLRGV